MSGGVNSCSLVCGVWCLVEWLARYEIWVTKPVGAGVQQEQQTPRMRLLQWEDDCSFSLSLVGVGCHIIIDYCWLAGWSRRSV
jgi:hypothetical protein